MKKRKGLWTWNRRSVTAALLAALVASTTIIPGFSSGGEIHLINDLGGFWGETSVEAQMERDWNEDIISVAKGAWLDSHAGEDRERHDGGYSATMSSLPDTGSMMATGSDLVPGSGVPAVQYTYDVFEDIDEGAAASAVASYLKKARKAEKANSGDFLRKMLKEAVIPEDGVPRDNDLKKEILALDKMNDEDYEVFRTDAEYTPAAGDIIFVAGRISTGEDSPASASDAPAPLQDLVVDTMATPSEMEQTVAETEITIVDSAVEEQLTLENLEELKKNERTKALKRNAKHAVLAGIIIAGPENTGSDKIHFIYSTDREKVEIGVISRNEVRIIGYADMEQLHDKYCGILEEIEEEAEEPEEETPEVIEKVPNEKTEYTWKNDVLTVTATLTDPEAIPDDAELVVTPVTRKTEGYNYQAYMDALTGEISSAAEENTILYDVAFLADETDENGEKTGRRIELQPENDKVRVSFRYSSAALTEEIGARYADKVKVVHLPLAEAAKENTDTTKDATSIAAADITPECLDASIAVGTNSGKIEFQTEGFSVFAITYTVDFHWVVNGKTYEFSIPGGGFVGLAEIVELLGLADEKEAEDKEISEENRREATEEKDSTEEKEITEENDINERNNLIISDIDISEATRQFVAEVKNVEFSSPELLNVCKVKKNTTVGALKDDLNLECEYSADLTEEQIKEINEQAVEAGEWALISVHPFSSEEALTVTMKNGADFTIKITDGQLRTYVISDKGDTYEIIVTYDDTAEIPEDAELRVREIKNTEEEFTKNIEATNKVLRAQDAPIVENSVQFDISIVSDGKVVEPKNGSTVKVEVRLAKMLSDGKDVSQEGEKEGNTDTAEAQTDNGEIWFGGVMIDKSGVSTEPRYTVSHITDDGQAEVIDNVKSSVTEDEKVVLQFETTSFSDYLMGNPNGLDVLPSTIYVGDEIYMWQRADYWVTNINSVVNEIKHPNGYGNDGSDWKTVRAISTGTFRIYNRYNHDQYKEITVLPARTGTTPPATIPTVDNASIGLTLNLFDYDLDNYLDDYFNNYNHGDNPVSSNFLNHDINNGHNLKFWGSGIGNNHGSQNQYQEHGVTSIVKKTLDTGAAGGYPVLSTDNTSLSYLFTPSDGTDKKAYTNVNGLFKKDGDYYVYDSDQNYAYYDPTQGNNGRFAVYERTYKQKSGGESGTIQNKSIGFFPFHKWDEEYDLYVNWNKKLNHHFGMSMSVPFSMPKDPKAVLDTNGDPIVFEFSGDDDLWVFIDGKLIMDIGGIHQPTSGTINFQTGTVTVNGQTQMNRTAFTNTFPDLYDGKQHTLQVFYIERGGCDSNCKIKFNMTLYGDIHFDKVDKNNTSEKLAGAVFGIYKDVTCSQPLMENLKNGNSRAYIAESDANGRVQFSDIPVGTFYLKELHAPEGYPLDDTVHTVQVYVDQNTGQVKVKVTIDGVDVETGVKILNGKTEPINIGLQKKWQDKDGVTIAAPEGASATFEIKRIRNYETYTEQTIEGEERQVSHLTVGWIHNEQTHVYGEYDLIAGSTATVSWGYNNEYTGSKDCFVNGTRIDKDYVSANVISQGLTMPAAGGTSTIFIVDESENGDAIRNINVAGSQFYGNSGGGVIHTFTTHTEPDPTFSYTGEHVTNNRVTLPINSNTWSYIFDDLPTFARGRVDGVDHDVSFNYSYYLEEVSSNSPTGTTVVYRDLAGNVISAPTDAETSASGTLNITNKVPTGYLRIDKAVTFNGVQPATDAQKSALAGEYTFKVYTDENCSKPYKVIQGGASNQQEVDLVLTVTIEDDGAAKSSDTVKIPVGDYWIEEQTPSQTGVTPDENRIKVTITADKTTNNPAVASFTNNKEESDNPDELAIELEKTFTGLSNASKIPANYKAVLTYTYGGSPVSVDLTGSTQGNVTCIKSSDGLTWHWRITQIPKNATNFGVYESNYDIAGYTRITKINGKEVQNPEAPESVSVLVPEITMTNITSNYTTTDNNKVFTVEDNQILLVRMTNHATVIVSQKSLSLAARHAIEKMLRENGGKIPGDSGANAQWEMNFVYFSHEIQGDSFAYGGRTIYFDGKQVKIPHKSSSHEVRVDIGYTSTSAENSFTLENSYTEIPTEVDVLKVEKDKETTTHLPGAVFELRKLEDAAPANPDETLTYVKDDNQQVIVTSATTGDNGRLSFSNLTYGVYEIREVTPPPGFIQTEDVTIYIRVDGGMITHVQKGNNKPSEWTAVSNSEGATVFFVEAQEANPDGDPPTAAANATLRVSNTPSPALPATGGPGSDAIYLFGTVLVTLAGAGLLMRRRKYAA